MSELKVRFRAQSYVQADILSLALRFAYKNLPLSKKTLIRSFGVPIKKI